MIHKLLPLAVAIVASPAIAQDQASTGESPTVTDPGSAENGYRSAEAADGFRLVEHGIWPNAEGTLDSSLAVEVLSGSNNRSERSSSFRRAAYLPHIYAAEAQFALPVGLLDALVWTESRYDPLAVSKAGAAGLGQLMPGTARDLGVRNRFDPLENLIGAARYLRQMLDRFGAVHLALAAYNAGPGAVERANGIPRNGETPAYVRNVLRRWRP